ncbi:MFS transporter [Tsukamurella asaccharolytica]|uniref:MFS transporter n=1 Tax=Tsukamurella asaccharolytica TaxID=2592067 RepID=UPI00131556AE|nr:MFS transporter [Tsukamurella asaccharolytica]
MTTPTETTGKNARRVIVASAAGNFVEWFDFSIYGLAAATLATVFFAPGSESTGLLGVFAVYGVAFLARPAGAVFFGRIGDRLGRRAALSLSIIIMGASTAAIGLLPGWATVGVAAPALLVLCRLMQGFSAGGEYSGAVTFVVEHAPERRRGLWLGLLGMSTLAGPTAATMVILGAKSISGDAYADWGWRLPFLLGGVIAIIGLFLRRGVEESPVFQKAQAEEPVSNRGSLGELLRLYWRPIVVVAVYFATVGVIAHMFLGYIPTYMTTVGGVGMQEALAIMTVLSIIGMALTPITGTLTDRIGRRPLLRLGLAGVVVLMVPAYLLVGTGHPILMGIGLLGFMIPMGLLGSGALAILEILPARVRYSGIAIPYNVTYAVFAGTAPLVSESLVTWTGNQLCPAFYGAGIGLVGLLVLWRWIPETRGADLVQGAGFGDSLDARPAERATEGGTAASR